MPYPLKIVVKMKNEILDITQKIFHNHLTPEYGTTFIMDLWGENKTNENLCRVAAINSETLEALGYKRQEWTDKNSPRGGFYDMKHVIYSKKLNGNFSISIVYFYTADIPDNFSLKKHYAELEGVAGSSLPLPLDIDHIERVYKMLLMGV
jgi:hypothetical protein